MRITAPRSLLGQFVLLTIVVGAGAAIALLWSASALLHQTADHFQRELLRRQALIVAASIRDGDRPDHPVVLTDGMAVVLIGPDRRVVSADGPTRPDILAAAPLDRRARFFRRGAIEGYALPVDAGWIVVSQDDADPEVVTDDIVSAFLTRFALISLPIAALVPLIGAVLARRLTLRMRAISAIAATIGPRSLGTRLPVGRLPLEAEPLASATNAALDRLAAAMQVQAAFAADVAHELRTPLAAIRLRADAVAEPALRSAILSAVDRTARIITQLLALAELEGPVEDSEATLDLHALAEVVVADRAPAIFAAGRSIALDRGDAPAPARGYAEAITLALENLVDNAARHTPPGTAIVVRSGPGARLAVADDGPGVPDAHLARLADRLWRSDGGHTEGSGIGLSIVDRIARAHHGTLSIGRGADGRGLVFVIALDDAAAGTAGAGANAACL